LLSEGGFFAAIFTEGRSGGEREKKGEEWLKKEESGV
jgi:hypothetical protein